MAKPLSFDFLPYLTGLQFQGILIISYEIQVISYFLTL